MLIAEIMAVAAVAVQFFLPTEVGISIHFGHRALGLPIRWVVPMFFIFNSGCIECARAVCSVLAIGARGTSSARTMSDNACLRQLGWRLA